MLILLDLEETVIEDWSNMSLDPHFSGDSSINCGLVARFIPTEAGWEMAKTFCEVMG